MDPKSPTLPHVVILNQYYAPDVASTGQLLHELAVELASHDYHVKVVTSRPSYGPPETWKPVAWRETADGVQIRRLWTTRYSKDNMFGRALNIATFVIPLTLRMLFLSKADDVHLYTTNPPFLGSVGMLISRVRKHRYVLLLHDAHPQVGVWTGKVRAGSFVERLWMWLNRKTYKHADQSIVLCEAAKKLVSETYNVAPERVHVIHNWADAAQLKPLPKAEQPFAKEQKLVEPFVLMYSGNLGLYYEFETMLSAAEKLKGENFKLVLIGSGGRRQWIAEQIKSRNLTNTILLPYQPIEKLHESLNSCDCSGVTIAKGIEGISFPSKLYSSLAVGKPVIAISEPVSELRSMIEDHGVGRWCELGDVDGLVRIIKQMMNDPQACKRQGEAARRLFEQRYTREISCAKYAEVLKLAAPGTVSERRCGPGS